MALTYRAEYRLGPLGRRIDRSCGGLHALAAIASDLLLALVFGVIGLALGLVSWVIWLAYRLVRLAFLAIRAVAEGVARGVVAAFRPPARAAKPAWPGFDEL